MRACCLTVLVLSLASMLAYAVPRVTSVEPEFVTYEGSAVARGKDLGEASVDRLYLTAEGKDIEVEITEQSAEEIKFDLPDSNEIEPMKRYRLMVLTTGASPAYMEQAVSLEVVDAEAAKQLALEGEVKPWEQEENPRGSKRKWEELSPAVLVDRRLIEADAAIRERDYERARTEMEGILALVDEHGFEVPAAFYFHYADVLSETNSLEKALETVVGYLRQSGRGGPNYQDAMRLMAELETRLAERKQQTEQAERERAAKAERERAAKAELERAVARAREVLQSMEFVRVPDGEFLMGASAINDKVGRVDSAGRVRVIRARITKAFELGKFEVTEEEWGRVMGNVPSSRGNCGRCPITDVTWEEIQRFIYILTAADVEGRTYSLPTEAQWEYAFRFGAPPESYPYKDHRLRWNKSWHRRHHTWLRRVGWLAPPERVGEDWDVSNLQPVGQKEPNALGLHDMVGNAQERVQDWYAWVRLGDDCEARFFGGYSSRNGVVTDPVGPSEGHGCKETDEYRSVYHPARVVRGGSSAHGPGFVRRFFGIENQGSDGRSGAGAWEDLGFRLARTAQ